MFSLKRLYPFIDTFFNFFIYFEVPPASTKQCCIDGRSGQVINRKCVVESNSICRLLEIVSSFSDLVLHTLNRLVVIYIFTGNSFAHALKSSHKNNSFCLVMVGWYFYLIWKIISFCIEKAMKHTFRFSMSFYSNSYGNYSPFFCASFSWCIHVCCNDRLCNI